MNAHGKGGPGVYPKLTRRALLQLAASLSAAPAWAGTSRRTAVAQHVENRLLFPQGVASGDPAPDSVVLWTRRPFATGNREHLRLEVATERDFSNVIVSKIVPILADADWTCRVLVGNLLPSKEYWYRFVDMTGAASRTGRTITAPDPSDNRPVKFAFVSCQNINLGFNHAYRRMIYDDDHAASGDKIEFVLHLGDFIYEMMFHPEDNPNGFMGRTVRQVVRYSPGEKVGRWWIPTSLGDYRALYREYLSDEDIQDARANWPFIPMWDNEEFSDAGYQSFEVIHDRTRISRNKKIAANQAWWEYQPARVVKSGGSSLETFNPPRIIGNSDPVFDDAGFDQSTDNVVAVNSLQGYRALQWGKHVELLITDQHSYRSPSALSPQQAGQLYVPEYGLFPAEALEIADAGKSYDNGTPPDFISTGGKQIPNDRKSMPPQTGLGVIQKNWLLARLKGSKCTWKVWSNSQETLLGRIDVQNLPPNIGTPRWPSNSYGVLGPPVGGGLPFGGAWSELGQIYDFVDQNHITGLATLSGNIHSFWAGLSSKSLPPKTFKPVGIAFATGSICAPGGLEAMAADSGKLNSVWRSFWLSGSGAKGDPLPLGNMLVRHGVRSCLEYQKNQNANQARQFSNAELSPHLSFVDLFGHGFTVVTATSTALECEFVCISRPNEPSTRADGSEVLYRVAHRASIWKPGDAPQLTRTILEGNPALSI